MTKQSFQIPMDQRLCSDHFGEQTSIWCHLPQKIAAMAVCPLHHRSNTQPAVNDVLLMRHNPKNRPLVTCLCLVTCRLSPSIRAYIQSFHNHRLSSPKCPRSNALHAKTQAVQSTPYQDLSCGPPTGNRGKQAYLARAPLP